MSGEGVLGFEGLASRSLPCGACPSDSAGQQIQHFDGGRD